MKIRIILSILLPIALCGCASISEHHERFGEQPIVYPGVRAYAANTAGALGLDPDYDPGYEEDRLCVTCLFPWLLVDGLVLTPVMDTVLLPVDLIWIMLYESPEEESNKILEDTGTSAPDPQD